MHLKQPGFTYSVCGPFTKTKKDYKNLKKKTFIFYIRKIFIKAN